MRILVQKFGGTSVADIDRLKMVRGKVKAALDQGYKVVVVLSAKSGKSAFHGRAGLDRAFQHVAQGLRHQGAFDARLADPDHHE